MVFAVLVPGDDSSSNHVAPGLATVSDNTRKQSFSTSSGLGVIHGVCVSETQSVHCSHHHTQSPRSENGRHDDPSMLCAIPDVRRGPRTAILLFVA